MAAERDIELLQDRTLADSARRGGREAFDELYRRHARAAWRLALVVTRDGAAAEAAVAGAFRATLARTPDRAPGAVDDGLRVTLLRATRRAAIDAVTDAAAHPTSHLIAGPATAPQPLHAFEPRVAVIRRAFDALPERWRSVLWLVDVEGFSTFDAARVIRVAPGAAGPLMERARLGLQEQVLLTGLRHPSPVNCRRTTDRLTGYVADSLAPSDEAQVRGHLDRCAACRGRLAALDDLVPVLRSTSLALPLYLGDDAAARWANSLVRDSGPLHLVMPGGQPMPAWAQRAFAGALAAVIALGITGATIIAGRGRSSGRDVTIRPVTADGESALGGNPGLSDLELSGRGFVAPTTGAGTGPAVAAATPNWSGAALPRTSGSTSSPVYDQGTVLPPALPSTGTTPPSAPAPGPTPSSDAVVTVVIPEVVGITVGPSCTGIDLGGTVLGCEPPATPDPITIGGTAVPTSALGL